MNASLQPNALPLPHWPSLPADAKLADGTVQVIHLSLDVPADRLAQLNATLSADERVRAAKFYFRDGRDSYVAGRGQLREVLGHFLGVAPPHVKFRYGANGKPGLAGAGANASLRFNLAHSGADAVVALSPDGPIGVDLERMREIPDLLQMLPVVLSESERREWDMLDEAERQRAFFDCWVRKEAFLKGLGEGLQRPLGEIEVPLRRSDSDEALAIVDRGCEVGGWSLRSLSTGDFASAVAVKGSPVRVSCWRWKFREQ